MRNMMNLLRQSFWALSLFSVLLLPVSQAYSALASAAFCGNGQAQSALVLKMQQIAPAELLEHLGISQAQDEHCPQCPAGGFAALAAGVFALDLRHFAHITAMRLRNLAQRRLPDYFRARAPPSFSV